MKNVFIIKGMDFKENRIDNIFYVEAPRILFKKSTEKNKFEVIIEANLDTYYTTDNTDPRTSPTKERYGSPFNVSTGTTIKAVSVSKGGRASGISIEKVENKKYSYFYIKSLENNNTLTIKNILSDLKRTRNSNILNLFESSNVEKPEPVDPGIAEEAIAEEKESFEITVEYKTEDGNWTILGTVTETEEITLDLIEQQPVYLRASTPAWAILEDGEAKIAFNIRCSKLFEVGGNIMSLLYGSNFTGNETEFPATQSTAYPFSGLFWGKGIDKGNIGSAKDLYLPAQTLTPYCYENMFNGCTYLDSAPKLPATILAEGCYKNMFKDCSELSDIINLPASALDYYCYQGMFSGCPKLEGITVAFSDWAVSKEATTGWTYFNGDKGIFTCPESLQKIQNDSKQGIYDYIPEGWEARSPKKNTVEK